MLGMHLFDTLFSRQQTNIFPIDRRNDAYKFMVHYGVCFVSLAPCSS